MSEELRNAKTSEVSPLSGSLKVQVQFTQDEDLYLFAQSYSLGDPRDLGETHPEQEWEYSRDMANHSSPLSDHCDWFAARHMTQLDQLESLGASDKWMLGGKITFSLT